MLVLVLSILFSALIYVVFKYLDIFKARTFEAIVYNYITATAFGFLIIFFGNSEVELSTFNILNKDWLWISIIQGCLFISVFLCMALTAQKLSVTASSVASKMSMVIPIGIFIFLNEDDNPTSLKLIGILLACIAVFLTTARKDSKWDNRFWYLPLIIFLGSGTIDFFIGYAEQEYLHSSIDQQLFIPSIFAITGIIGVIILLYQYISRKHSFNYKSLVGGVVLGAVNYGSLFFLIKALESPDFVKSSVFSINNMGIIATSAIFAIVLFKEKLSLTNILGLILGIISISIILVN